jgi:hypothetical protein
MTTLREGQGADLVTATGPILTPANRSKGTNPGQLRCTYSVAEQIS